MGEIGRLVRSALSHPPGDGTPMPGLDLSGLVLDPPRMHACSLAEHDSVRAVSVDGGHTAKFAAFLDGVQRSHVIDYAGTVPVVAGRTAAVIRARVERRMTTWGDGVRSQARVYAPLQLLSPLSLAALQGTGLEFRDTLPANEEVSGHPMELLRRAVDCVKRDRELAELELAESWVTATDALLFVDGGLPPGPAASVATNCVGVVKSHTTIYVPPDGLPTVLGLREGERSSAFIVDRKWGPRVVSWYLRLREPPTHDPFRGLVRVEVASGQGEVTARADEASGWILAERSPLSLPDARWDRMVYGIHDCEEYLRATAG